MILARFGEETFHVNSQKGIYTFSDLSFEYGKELENQGTTGKKPISYITALTLIKTGFKIHLDCRYVDVESRRLAWRNMAESSNVYAFSIGGEFVSKNKFAVQSVKESNIRINGKGQILSMDLDVSIQEFAGATSIMGILQKRLADYE